MLHPIKKSMFWKILFRGLTIFLVVTVMLGTLPWGNAHAETSSAAAPAQLSGAQPQENQPPPGSTEPKGSDQPLEFDPYPLRTYTSTSTAAFGAPDVFEPVEGMIPSGDFLIAGSSATGESLPGGINTRSLPAGMITVDLTYDVVIGWVSPGDSVVVTADTNGYGAALADEVGFFWTPVWDTANGQYLDVLCDMTIVIQVNTYDPIETIPPCLDAGLDIVQDLVTASIEDDTGGTTITATLGAFDIWSGGQPPAPGAPSAAGETESNGSFSLALNGVDLGAESLVALDRVVDGVNIRSYAYPEPPVFMVQQYNTIAGYAPIGQHVTATVFADDTKVDVVWEGFTTANAPHGYYLFENVEMTIGNDIEVSLDGGLTLSTTVIALGNFDFDGVAETLEGTAPEGASVRANLWQWSGEERLYKQAQATAGTGDTFSMDLSSIGLQARDDVLVVVTDAAGNQVQLLSGMPFVNAWMDLRSDIDCVSGRLDGPDLPIFTRLEKTGEEPYTRDPEMLSDAGNNIVYCFTMRDSSENFVNFNPGDIVTLHSGDPDGISAWAGTVEIVPMNWSANTALNSISGALPEGELEISVAQWNEWAYPLHGRATQQIAHNGLAEFTASFGSFDVRDGNTVYLSHFDPIMGYGNYTHNWITPEVLPHFELQLPNGITGQVTFPDEVITAQLYEGETLLAETSDDHDDDPYRYWLGDFGEYSLQTGYRVVVSNEHGWQAEMVIPELTIEGDVTTNTIAASGPEGLLFMEVYDGDYGLSLFVPGPDATLKTTNYGFDLLPSATIAVTYVAPDGNRARLEQRLADISEVNFWLNPGTNDGMWGMAKPGTQVTAYKGVELMFTTYANPACGGCWEVDEPVEINPGDVIKVATDVDEFGVSDYEVTFTVPTPLTAAVDTSTDIVSGQIGGRSEDWVQVNGWWEDGYAETTTEADGSFSVNYDTEFGVDIPSGADGFIHFSSWEDYTEVRYHQYFQSMDLILNINYNHDWIEGNYAPGYLVTLTVYDNDKLTVKATTSMVTGEIPWWGGGTGFSTNLEGTEWIPEHPNIQPGDWVIGEVIVGEETSVSEVRLGTINGRVDVDANSFTGTLYAPWLDPLTPVEVQCHPWGAPHDTESRQGFVLPDDTDEFTCGWSDEEWDIKPGQDLAVLYRDPEGHWVYAVFQGYPDEPILSVHYDHDWINGPYEPGHMISLIVYDSEINVKATTTLETQVFDDWGGWSGFATNREDSVWSPWHPDIQPGDTVHASVDSGAFTATVKVGAITAETDLDEDRVTGTVDATWLIDPPYEVDEVDVGCYTWEENGRNVYTTAILNETDNKFYYTCEFTGENYFDLDLGTNLMVAYFEPDGHEIIGDFRYPSPHLRVEKWLDGGGSPGAGGYAEFYLQYANHGELPAEDVVITDTMDGFVYVSDTSGLTHSNEYGDEVITWELGTVQPGDWISFKVFAEVTAEAGVDVSNLAEISTSNPYDQGDEWEKRGEWWGTVEENTTDLNVGIDPWTWDPAAGENFVYTVGVCNNGATGSLPITLDINFGENLTLYDGPFGVWWARESGWLEAYSDSGQLTLSRPTISGQYCLEVYVRVTVDALAEPGDGLYTEAAVTAGNETNPENNETSIWHHVGEPYTDLAIWQNWHWGSLTPGGYYRYGIDFRNNGNLPVSDSISVTATLPDETSFVGWDKWGWASVGEPVVNGQEVTWQVNVRDPGFGGTIEVWVNIKSDTTPGTTLTHEAEIEVQVGEENEDNNYSMMEEKVYEPGPNLRIRKWGDWHGHGEGHNAWYQLQVENIGTETIYDVVITDDYDAKMVLENGPHVNFWEGWSWEDHPDEHYFTVTLDRLEPGWNVGINYDMVIPGEVTPGMEFNNLAIVPVGSDVNPVDNGASFTLISTYGPAPHLQIEHWFIGDGSPGEGGNAAFWVQFRNQGDALAENVMITDTMVGLTYLRDTSGGITTAVPGDGQVTWALGDLEPGEWIGFVVFSKVTATAGQPYSNTVTIETDSLYDQGDEGEKTSTWEGTVAANDTYLNVGKWSWTEHPAPGEDYVYTINVCNYGTTSSSTVTLEDWLPENTTFVSWWGEDVGWYEVDVLSDPIELAHTCISPGSCSEVNIRLTLSGSAAIDDPLTNIAEISGGNDLSPEDNRAEAQHSVGGAHTDLAIWQGFQSGSLVPGGHYNVFINFKNHGNVGISSPIAVTATLPVGTNLISYDKWGWANVGEPDINGQVVTWQVDGLAPGYDGTIGLWLEIDPSTPVDTELVHHVEIAVQLDEVNTENNASTFTEIVYANGPNLRIFKWGGWHGDGRNAWYQLRVENVGDDTVDDVVITDEYAADMVLNGNVNVNFWDEWSWGNDEENHTLWINMDRLEPGWSVGINYDMAIPESVTLTPGEKFTNNAVVTPSDNYPDDNNFTFELFVEGEIEDTPPAITSPGFTTFVVDQQGSFLVNTTGVPTPTISYTGGLPGDVSLTDNGDGSATLTGTPVAGSEGQYELTITAGNGIGENAVQTFKLTVATEAGTTDEGGGEITFEEDEIGIEIPPGAVTGATEFIYVQQSDPSQDPPANFNFAGISFQLTAIDTATGEPVTEFSEPVKITIHYNPDDLVGIVEETLQLFYWDEVGEAWVDAICDGHEYTRNLTDNWFSLHICHLSEFAVMGEVFVNSPPVAYDQTVQTTENVQVAITLTATDADGDPLTYEVVTDPSHGTLEGTAPNLTYTPTTDYLGSDSFTFKANDGIDDSNVATVTINVVELTESPAITSEDHTTFTVGINGSYTFTATGIPTPVISLTGALPDGLTFTSGTGTATLTGIPATGSLRTYSLTVTASNAVEPDDDQTFTLTINTPPVANAGPDQTVTASTLVTLDGSGSTDPDDDSLTYAWTQISGTSVALSDAAAQKPTFTAPSQAGILTFSLTVMDPYGVSFIADTVMITVEEAQTPTYKIFLPLISR